LAVLRQRTAVELAAEQLEVCLRPAARSSRSIPRLKVKLKET